MAVSGQRKAFRPARGANAHGPASRRTDAPRRPELEALLHLHMLEHGYTYARRGFIALSLPLGEDEIDGFASAVEAFLTQR